MATPAQLAEAEAWLDQFGDAIATLDAGTVAAIIAAYQEIEDWNDPAVTLLAAGGAMAASTAGRQAVAELGAQFISVITGILRGTSRRSTGPTPSYPRNADPFDVYSRPIFAYRDAIARGQSEIEAEILAFQRAEMIALTDNILARRDAALAQLEREEIKKYRRVIRPELSETGVCGLCIAASTRIYNTGELMPIHTRCKCEVIPIIGSDDVGGEINIADLKSFYASIPSTRKQDLVKTRYTVKDLAELGPVLTPAAA